MRDALVWLGSFFGPYGGILIGLVAVLAVMGVVLRECGPLGGTVARWCFKIATVALVVFVIVAIAFALRE